MKICVPIKAPNMDILLSKISQAQSFEKVDLIELWLDQVKDLNLTKVFEIAKKPLLAVCKDAKEMGAFGGTEMQRLALLARFVELGGAYIDSGEASRDFEFFDQYRREYNFQIIASFHDFQLTPSLEELYELIDHRFSWKIDIIKIATQIKKPADLDTLSLALERILYLEKKPIVIGMGNMGRPSRLGEGVFAKNYLTFAALSPNEITAPGQVSLDEL